MLPPESRRICGREKGHFMQASRRRCAVLAVALALGLLPASAAGQSVEDFYRGKTINVIIGYPTAGANDHYARTLARHIGKHIPGQPKVIARNMPGGGSLIAANHVFNIAPKDGTTLSLLAATIPLEGALGASGVKFRSSEFNWIGRMASAINVTIVNATSPVKTIKDAFEREVVLAATGRSGTPALYPSVLNNVVGTKFKVVMGYEGSIACMLAMERGEAEGHSTSWDGVKSARGNWLKDKTVNIVVQYGLQRHPELPEVPMSWELGRNDEEKQILRIVANATEVGKMMLTTPGVPADRVAALRRAFDATIKDPDYVAEMSQQHLEIIPLSGEEMQKLVGEVGGVSPAILQKVKAIYPLN
jgi:tripartite-type tricarboxylate transporter receptor subunit TctC